MYSPDKTVVLPRGFSHGISAASILIYLLTYSSLQCINLYDIANCKDVVLQTVSHGWMDGWMDG